MIICPRVGQSTMFLFSTLDKFGEAHWVFVKMSLFHRCGCKCRHKTNCQLQQKLIAKVVELKQYPYFYQDFDFNQVQEAMLQSCEFFSFSTLLYITFFANLEHSVLSFGLVFKWINPPWGWRMLLERCKGSLISNHSTMRERMLLDPCKRSLQSFCENMDIGLEKSFTLGY
jgi:hypothetical protein